MKNPNTSLCYIECCGKYLMLHRIKKEADVNAGKWIGIGGHFEEGETPEECMIREVFEETGLKVSSWRYRGIVTFTSEGYGTEYMHLFTAELSGDKVPEDIPLPDCDEGILKWVPLTELDSLPQWEGDRVFLDLIRRDLPFFSLKLSYKNDVLVETVLDGKKFSKGY